MEVEVSRRRFLGGTVAMTIFGGAAVSTGLLSGGEEKHNSSSPRIPKTVTTKTGTGEAEKVPFLCGMCVNKCAGYARVEDGIITKLDPNPHFPKSRNMLCPRGNAGIQTTYDPDRLKYPLIRVGERGSGKFKRISWEEAYDAILNGTDKFKGLKQILDEEKDNRATIGYCNGEGLSKEGFETLVGQKLGSPNYVDEVSICLETAGAGFFATLGVYPEIDFEHADYLIISGANRAEAIITPDTQDMFKHTKRRGIKKTVCIDPRFTNTAAKADKWLPVNPGTDLAFVLALTWVVFNENLQNEAFMKKYGVGYEEYKQHILSHKYTPEWAEPICGIKAKDIYTIAREFMQAEAPVYYPGRRSVFSPNDYQLRRAMAIFQALSGNIDKKGGYIYGNPIMLPPEYVNAPIYDQAKERFDTEGIAFPTLKSGSWIVFRNMVLEGKNPYPLRVMFMRKHNPMMSVPNSAKTAEFLKKMDLNVMIDILPSDTAMYADVILPEASYLERTSPVKAYGFLEPAVVMRKAAIKPLYETKEPEVIYKELAEKLAKPLFEISKKYDKDLQEQIKLRGEKKVFEEDGWNLADAWELPVYEKNKEIIEKAFGPKAWEILDEKGVYYPHMEEYFKQLNPNEYQYYPKSKKFYSTMGDKKRVVCKFDRLATRGIDPMPTWHDEWKFSVPEGKFRLITGRHAQFTQSGTTNNAMLRDLIPTNYLWINKRTAKKMGIEFGDKVEIKSEVGKGQLLAYPTEKIAPNQVFMLHGFGSQSEGLELAYGNGCNDAAIIKDDFEPVFGAAVMHSTNVEIRKV
ncbi:molybdopterin-containing oxidoreductase family protein [Nitratifractor salsuginis]|uniref:Molybdopterin dinucleotide-binding region n=1 Tax=Nitratifractor salsuginis (strain DSM 16511 / JCM 12458 / E9I37-1) TaxID=749222 RepID=E6X1L1_NITSE|nr:molybdopterin-dependent oxidoreductase [Nitratifractor salsuginis]ADV47002.1 molybdopterin dinucleotide-binding region [Nitratifractor salsuginis DSM 16511]